MSSSMTPEEIDADIHRQTMDLAAYFGKPNPGPRDYASYKSSVEEFIHDQFMKYVRKTGIMLFSYDFKFLVNKLTF